MHPEIACQLASERRADLLRSVRESRRAGQSWPAATWLRLQRAAGCRHSGGASRLPQPEGLAGGMFLAGPEAAGFRAYLTDAEAGQLVREWAGLLSRFSGRGADPASRPADAVPFEVVLLGRRVPDLAGAGRALPGPGE